MDTSCIILAGGKSVRLGHDKVLEKIGSSSLLEQVISRIDSLSKEIIVVTSEKRVFPQLKEKPRIKIVSDIFPRKGSLGGIYTGLVASETHYNIVVAADMPFLNQPLLRYMLEVSDGFDFVLPRINTFFEPLHAVYSRNCLEEIRDLLEKNVLKVHMLLKSINVRYIESDESRKIDPDLLSYFNINHQSDLDQAVAIAKNDKK